MATDFYEKIGKEIIKIANTNVISHLTSISQNIYQRYVQQLKEDIIDFGFSGSVSGDYDTTNYWEEFCLVTQEGYDQIYDMCYDDIYGYILDILSKSPKIDIKLLYSGTEEVDIVGIENPLSIHTGMDECIANKLFYMLSYMAESEDIMHILYPDEDDEDYDDE